MIKVNQLPKDLKKSLDLMNFEIIKIISPKNRYPVIIMRDKRKDAKDHWCVQHQGSGYYFRTLKEVKDYCKTRNWVKTF